VNVTSILFYTAVLLSMYTGALLTYIQIKHVSNYLY